METISNDNVVPNLYTSSVIDGTSIIVKEYTNQNEIVNADIISYISPVITSGVFNLMPEFTADTEGAYGQVVEVCKRIAADMDDNGLDGLLRQYCNISTALLTDMPNAVIELCTPVVNKERDLILAQIIDIFKRYKIKSSVIINGEVREI